MIIWYIYHIIRRTNGFVKKSVKTPRREIRIAKEAKDDFMERGVGNEEDENAWRIYQKTNGKCWF